MKFYKCLCLECNEEFSSPIEDGIPFCPICKIDDNVEYYEEEISAVGLTIKFTSKE